VVGMRFSIPLRARPKRSQSARTVQHCRPADTGSMACPKPNAQLVWWQGLRQLQSRHTPISGWSGGVRRPRAEAVRQARGRNRSPGHGMWTPEREIGGSARLSAGSCSRLAMVVPAAPTQLQRTHNQMTQYCSHCELRDAILNDPHYQFCPSCGKPSHYSEAADRFVHSDGSANRLCWVAITRGVA
jgi:hypothetical protein